MADTKTTEVTYPEGLETIDVANPKKRTKPPASKLIPVKFRPMAQDVANTLAEAHAARDKAQAQISANQSILWNFVDAG